MGLSGAIPASGSSYPDTDSPPSMLNRVGEDWEEVTKRHEKKEMKTLWVDVFKCFNCQAEGSTNATAPSPRNTQPHSHTSYLPECRTRPRSEKVFAVLTSLLLRPRLPASLRDQHTIHAQQKSFDV